ncbi:MAG: hypothetical protein AAF986_10270 [Pseudomonadota bacterium]
MARKAGTPCGPCATTAQAYHTAWRRPPQLVTDRRRRLGVQIGILVYLILTASSVEVDWQRVSNGPEHGQRFVMGVLQRDFTSD